MKMITIRRKRLTILFVMDAVEKIDCPNDTSTHILIELQTRGHRVFCAEPKDLELAGGRVIAHAKTVSVTVKNGYRVLGRVKISLDRMDAIFIRKDPPVDLEYFYMTYLLERVPARVLMINSPKGIRDSNEKLYSFQFKKWMPPSLAASNPDSILSFQNKLKSDVILKPLNDKGGHGISLLKLKDKKRVQMAKRATKNASQTILAQQFLQKGLTEGDKRILLWNGEIIGVFGRMPARGEFRANLSLGGKCKKASVTRREKEMISEMKRDFQRKGLIFVGLDTIAGFVTEINVTSPAGITDINYLYKTKLECDVVDRFENTIRGRSPC